MIGQVGKCIELTMACLVGISISTGAVCGGGICSVVRKLAVVCTGLGGCMVCFAGDLSPVVKILTNVKVPKLLIGLSSFSDPSVWCVIRNIGSCGVVLMLVCT